MKRMDSIRRILIIICQANGDVLLSSPLIQTLHETYPQASIDLVVNASTVSMAESLLHISNVYSYDYSWKKRGKFYQFKQEFQLFKKLWKKYDLSISLTSSDRSVLLAITSSRYAIAELDAKSQKRGWKPWLLKGFYQLDERIHMVLNHKKALSLLGITPLHWEVRCKVDKGLREAMHQRLQALGIDRFVIFHPSARGVYKVYPTALRHRLLSLLSQAGVNVVVTGGKSPLDDEISAQLPTLPHLYNFIGQCESIAELIALMDLSEAYLGMDTLNMHLAASLDKSIFAIFGPTNPCMWSPWSNALQAGGVLGPARHQFYGNIHLFQAIKPCVPCFKAGCQNNGIKSDCLEEIAPEFVVQTFLNAQNEKLNVACGRHL